MAQSWMWPGTSGNAAQQWGNLNPALRDRLRSFYDHASKSGYATAARPTSSYRTREDQIRAGQSVAARLGQTYDPAVGIPGYAASADGSRHRRGEAIDWHFRNPDAQKWFHENAGRFGLGFPIKTDTPHMQLVRDWNGESVPVVNVSRETQPQQGQLMAEKQPSMFGALARGFSSPQFMAGAAMFDSALRGGGIGQGAQMLQQAQQQEQEMAYRRQQQERAEAIRNQQMATQAPLNAARLKLLEAQAAKATLAGGPDYSKQPIYGTDANGKPVIMQLSPSGKATQTQLPDGVTPSTGVEKVDLGTKWGMLDRRSGQIVGYLPKDIAGEASQRAVGASQGDARVKLPMVENEANRVSGYIDKVLNHPAFVRMTSVAAGYLPNFSKDSRDFESRVGQLKGKAFTAAFERLKGAGAVTEAEGAKAGEALARLQSMNIGDANYRAALMDFKQEMTALVDLVRQRAGGGAAQPAPSGAGWSIKKVD